MSQFRKNIAPFVTAEIALSEKAIANQDFPLAFLHLENAHILGQKSTYWHVKVHMLMLIFGLRQKDIHEVFGQIIRIIGAALFTAVKGVPEGNTGGSNVSPIKVMPIKPEYAAIIKEASKP